MKELNTRQFQKSLKQITDCMRRLNSAADIETLRGIEGTAAAIYFEQLAQFFPEQIPFEERSRQPPRNAANALLSWTYTIVLSEVTAALRMHGLDPCFGWLHELRDGRASLALDLLEPLRSPVCDLFALKLFNQKILTLKHFEKNDDNGGTYLTKDARKLFFEHYETRMQRKFKSAPDAPHTTLRRCIRQQVWTVLQLLDDPDNCKPKFYQMP
jgi:CRISPR-associated protein Cas1